MADPPMDLLSDPVPVAVQAAPSTAIVPAKSPERDKGGKAGGLRIGGRKAAPVGTTERGLVVPQQKIVTTVHETRKKVHNECFLSHTHVVQCSSHRESNARVAGILLGSLCRTASSRQRSRNWLDHPIRYVENEMLSLIFIALSNRHFSNALIH